LFKKFFHGKRLAPVLLAALLALTAAIPLTAQAAQSGGTVAPAISIMLDGQSVATDVSAYIDANSRTMVPVRFISEALYAIVNWDGDTQTATITSASGKVITITIGSSTLNITENGVKSAVEMDTAAVIRDGRTFVPLRFIAEALGLTVGWDGATNTVILTTQQATASPSPSPSSAPDPATFSKIPDLGSAISGLKVYYESNVDATGGGRSTQDYYKARVYKLTDADATPDKMVDTMAALLKKNDFNVADMDSAFNTIQGLDTIVHFTAQKIPKFSGDVYGEILFKDMGTDTYVVCLGYDKDNTSDTGYYVYELDYKLTYDVTIKTAPSPAPSPVTTPPPSADPDTFSKIPDLGSSISGLELYYQSNVNYTGGGRKTQDTYKARVYKLTDPDVTPDNMVDKMAALLKKNDFNVADMDSVFNTIQGLDTIVHFTAQKIPKFSGDVYGEILYKDIGSDTYVVCIGYDKDNTSDTGYYVYELDYKLTYDK